MQLRSRLANSIASNFKFYKPDKLNSLFRYKDNLEKKIPSDLGNRYKGYDCKVTYCKTYRHFFASHRAHGYF